MGINYSSTLEGKQKACLKTEVAFYNTGKIVTG
jgi:hypothetical protein